MYGRGRKVKFCREQKKRFVGDDACIVPWPFAVCITVDKNVITLGWRAHNVRPCDPIGKNTRFNTFLACLIFVYPFAIQSLFLFLYSIILKFFRRSLFFKKGWKAPVNNHFAGQRLSAGIMAQRAAESFSVIFMWRQLGR